jgi:hypothetical protein
MEKLLKRQPNEAMLAAYRANGAKAHGATSARGRKVVRYNAAKHWGRAEMMRELLPALGEHPEDFEKLRKSLYDGLRPQDPFETVLVDDMADIHWRLRRMLRGEAGQLARARREEKARLAEEDAVVASGRLHMLEPSVAKVGGFVMLKDSGPKFACITERLETLMLMVGDGLFIEGGLELLKHIYGPNPGSRGGDLMTLYGKGVNAAAAGETERVEEYKAKLFDLLRREIAWFGECAADERQARAELRAPRIEAAMLEGKFDLFKSITYQEGMERRFERKWRLLMKHRSRRRREARWREAEQSSEADSGAPDTTAAGNTASDLSQSNLSESGLSESNLSQRRKGAKDCGVTEQGSGIGGQGLEGSEP